MVDELPVVREGEDELARVVIAVVGVSEEGTKCDDAALTALHFDLASIRTKFDFIPEAGAQVLVVDGEGG